MEEKRVVLRRRTYLAAQWPSRNGIAWSQGVVRNLSEAGALIETRGSPLPDTLDLTIPAAGVRTLARVAWRNGARAGLQFQSVAAPFAPPKSVARPRDDDANY